MLMLANVLFNLVQLVSLYGNLKRKETFLKSRFLKNVTCSAFSSLSKGFPFKISWTGSWSDWSIITSGDVINSSGLQLKSFFDSISKSIFDLVSEDDDSTVSTSSSSLTDSSELSNDGLASFVDWKKFN